MTARSAAHLPRFLTVDEVAEVLSVGAVDVHELVNEGQLRAIRVGSPGAWRIEVDELSSYVEAKYEESRRALLWREANLASVADFDSRQRSRSITPLHL